MPDIFTVVTEVISRERIEDQNYNEPYDAARKHGKHLTKGKADVMAARDFANVLHHSLAEADDYFCINVDTVIKEMQKRLSKPYSRLDSHSREHHNLFIAYFDLKRAGGAS